MLPGLRFLFAAVVLATSLLVFGLGATALMRAAHEEFASIPTRHAPEPQFAQQPETPMLAMMRVDPPPVEKAADSPAPIPAALPQSAITETPALPAVDDKVAAVQSDTSPHAAPATPIAAAPEAVTPSAEMPAPAAEVAAAPAQVAVATPAAPPAPTEAVPAAADTKIAATTETPTAPLTTSEPQPAASTSPEAPVSAATPSEPQQAASPSPEQPATKTAALGDSPAAVDQPTKSKPSTAKTQDQSETKKRAKRKGRRRVVHVRRARPVAAQQLDPFGQPMTTAQQR